MPDVVVGRPAGLLRQLRPWRSRAIAHLPHDGNRRIRTLVDGQNAPARVCPSVSKDGKQIAAIEYANDGSQGVVLMDADGSDAKIIATAGANQNIYAPRFSPFGSRIVFNEVTYNGDQIVNADVLLISAGGGITNITRRFDDQFFSPSWAPTGSTIVAVRGSPQMRSFGSASSARPCGR